jgi:hypothetical protein
MRQTALNLFSRLGRRAQLLALAAVLIVAPAASAMASAASASAASSPVSYSLAGTASSVPGGGCVDCQPPAMDASVTATCSACLAGDPASGSFAISLVVQTFPPSPCKVKSVTGTVNVTWNDGRTSSGAVSGKFRDSKTLALTGAFTATDPAYPGDAAMILLSNFPPNPCLAATNPVTGTLEVAVP